MIPVTSLNARIWSKIGSRGTYGLTMMELGKEYDDIMVLTADLCTTSGLDRFREAFPEKFCNVGIAEQNLIGIAGGLAKEGKNVFASSFATFVAMRAYEHVRLNLGYMGFNVKVVGLAAGFAMGMFGNTHYGIEDIALMRAIPGLCVLSPADCSEVVKATYAAAKYCGPVYLRLTGGMNCPVVYKNDYLFEIGKAVSVKEGHNIAIISTGSMVYQSIQAAKELEHDGISASVINMHTIKPLDTHTIDELCGKVSLFVTVEEHSIIGGLGGAVAEHLSSITSSPRLIRIGIPDAFQRVGDYEYLLEQNGLTGSKIAERIRKEYMADSF